MKSSVLILLILILSCANNIDKSSIAKNGVLNLFDGDKLVKLNGEWKFLKMSLLTLKELQ